MARLPSPGSDDGIWGDILNEFLLVEHDDHGNLLRAAEIGGKYEKPAGGIPKSDLASGVRDSLDKADGAITGISLSQSGTSVAGNISTLDFNASNFTVTHAPAGQANVQLQYGTGANQPAQGNHTHQIDVAINFIIDEGGAIISPGNKGDILIPFAATIKRWDLYADQPGNVQLDIWKQNYAAFPPSGSDSITGTSKPALSNQSKMRQSTLTGWTTSILADDLLRVTVISASVATRITLVLVLNRVVGVAA